MKIASLFTGAGGLDLGLHQAGHEVILQCESDPGAQQVLRKEFPGTLLYHDVCALTSLPKETELLTAGFPCIDVSRAGLRAGLQGKSSGLVRHVFRLLDQALRDRRGVPWVLLENVEALLDRSGGQTPLIDYVASQFEALGYHSWAHRVISSAGFGLPNRRKRVFVLASLHGDARDVLLSQGKEWCQGACSQLFGKCCYSCHDPDPADLDQHCSFALDLGNARSSPVIDMVPTFTTTNERICLLMRNGQMGSLRIEDAERLQGLPEGHTEACYPVLRPGVDSHKAPPLKDSDAEKREAERWALIGNAVTVPVAKWLGERLMHPYRYKYILGANDRKMQKASNGTPKPLIAPRDHFLDNAGLSESDSDHEAVEDGMLIEAPVTPEKPVPPTRNASDSSDQTQAGDPTAEGSGMVLDLVHQMTEAANDGIDKAGQAGSEQAVDARATASAPQVGKQSNAGGRRGSSGGDAGWPKAAWYLKGIGRHGVHSMSEAPLITPLVPLGEFITKLGRPAGKSALHTYLMRLREQGWDVSQTVKKAVQCGASLDKEMSEVVRLGGQPNETDACGILVWAQTEGDIWWPAEALDPFHMPPGKALPADALAGLSASQMRVTLPPDHPLLSSTRPNNLSSTSIKDAPSPFATLSPTTHPNTPALGIPQTPLPTLSSPVTGNSSTAPSTSHPQSDPSGPVKEAVTSIVTGEDCTLSKDAVSAEAADAAAMPTMTDADYTLPKDAVSAVTSGVKATASLCSAIVRSTERMMTRRMRARAGSLPATDLNASEQHINSQAPDQLSTQLNGSEQHATHPNNPEQNSTHVNDLQQHPTQLSGPEQAISAQPDAAAARVEPDGMVVLDSATGHATFDSEAVEDVRHESLDAEGSSAQHQSLTAPSGHQVTVLHGEGQEEPAAKEADVLANSFDSERLVLVVYLGDMQWKWLPFNTLLPFQKHRQEKVAEAEGLIAVKRLTKPILFNKALNQMGELLSLKQQQKDSGRYQAAVAARAATGAVAANLRKRCNQCEACLTSQGNQRRCLTNRAAAAAAAGHSGAQIAILKHAAIGARISVWWPLDEHWYSGVVQDFDRLRHRHTISYQDGDIEIIPLWAPNQMVRIESDPKEWPAVAAQLAAQRQQRQALQATHTKEKAAEQAATAAAQQQAVEEDAPEQLTSFEVQRRANIKRNQQRMASMGLSKELLTLPAEGTMPDDMSVIVQPTCKKPRSERPRPQHIKKLMQMLPAVPAMFQRDASKQQLCNVCGISGKQTDMQPCMVCLDVSKPSKASWCHEDCLSVAARHRMDKGRPAEWRCDACISSARAPPSLVPNPKKRGRPPQNIVPTEY